MAATDLHISNSIAQNLSQFRNSKDVRAASSAVGAPFQQPAKEDHDDDYSTAPAGPSVEEWVDKEFGGSQTSEETDLYTILRTQAVDEYIEMMDFMDTPLTEKQSAIFSPSDDEDMFFDPELWSFSS